MVRANALSFPNEEIGTIQEPSIIIIVMVLTVLPVALREASFKELVNWHCCGNNDPASVFFQKLRQWNANVVALS